MNSQPPRHRRTLILLGFALVACVVATDGARVANAQTQSPATTAVQTPAQTPAPIPAQPAATPASQPVKLDVIVTDESNRFVGDLRQEDFLVEEDGVPQSVTHFSKEVVPVSYGVLVDNSGSMKGLLEGLAQTAATLFLANQPGDEAMLSRFVDSDNINMLEDFTADPNRFAKALASMRTEGGQTAVIDAVYLTVKHIAGRRADETNRRRALVVITDGEDRVSYYRIAELEKLLEKANVQVFVIGLIMNLDKDSGFMRPSSREKSVKLINTLAQKTGGRAFVLKNMKELAAAVNEISHDLRTQYVIGYQPSNASRDGKFRKIQVKLSKTATAAGGKRIVHARPGYFAPGAKGLEKNEPPEKSLRLKSP